MSEKMPQINENEDGREGDSGIVYTKERAVEFVRILMERGNETVESLRGVRCELHDEMCIAREVGQNEAADILAIAYADVQTKLEALDPKERFAKIVEGKITEANELISAGKLTSAVGTLYSLLVDRRLVKYIAEEERSRLVALMNEIKSKDNLPIDHNFKGFPEGYKTKYK